jgi:hypothetical protein
MALKVTRRDLSGWKGKALRAQNRMKNISKKADQTVETVVHTAEVSSAAFVAGVVQGRTGGVEVLGVPMDLGLAAGLHVLAFAGVGGKMSNHLHGFGDGFLAAFLATTGRGVGQAMKAKQGTKAIATATSGALGSGSGASLSDMDRAMAQMAASI